MTLLWPSLFQKNIQITKYSKKKSNINKNIWSKILQIDKDHELALCSFVQATHKI